ncbi:hypothetical protein HanIR_Chr17g0892811 [Helianthus annuus]|nr:hypothetical protein HanIR_Chr17g0892811 [Helianthus annuus]
MAKRRQSGGYSAHVADYSGARVSMDGEDVSGQFGSYDSRIIVQTRLGIGSNVGLGNTGSNSMSGLLGPGPNLSQNGSAVIQPTIPPHFTQNEMNNTNGFGPTHLANWDANMQTPHYGLMADLSSICDKVDSWVPDSGATAHMTSDSSLVFGAIPYTGSERVVVGNNARGTAPPPHAW